jgi:hypothetical protein
MVLFFYSFDWCALPHPEKPLKDFGFSGAFLILKPQTETILRSLRCHYCRGFVGFGSFEPIEFCLLQVVNQRGAVAH